MITSGNHKIQKYQEGEKMTLGEKLAYLRRKNNYTQEQLAGMLEVSRQSISKWESNLAYPETKQLIRLGKLYECSMDYLLRDEIESEQEVFFYKRKKQEGENSNREERCRDEGDRTESTGNADNLENASLFEDGIFYRPYGCFRIRERKSTKTICGMPLWHIGKHARGFIAVGMDARGVIAVGLASQGIFSLGFSSVGLLSLGVASVGALSFGALSLGVIALGSAAVGVVAVGAVSVGMLATGGLAVGDFAIGGKAIGEYLAIGDYAQGMIAVGGTEAFGSLFEKIGEVTTQEIAEMQKLLDANVPSWLNWAKEIALKCLK